MLQARENLMETIQAFLKEYDHIPPEEKCMALLLADERFLKIKQAIKEEQNQPEEELVAQNFLINLNFPMADDDEYTIIYRKPKAITPDLPIEEPDNSLSMGDKHLNTISETEKSSVENLVPIPSEFKGISDDICDVPSCDNDHFDAECRLINSLLSQDISITSPKIDFLPEEFIGELDFIDLILPGIDEDNFDEDDFDEEEGEINDDILKIEDEILREKLLNVNILIDKIEALNLTPSIPFVLEYPSSSPIAVVDSDFLIEEVDTFLVPEDSIPPGIESDFDSEGDIIFSNDLLNDDHIPEYERFTFDIEPDAPVINNFDELNEDECFDPGGGEIDVSQNIEDDNSFAFVIQTFLPYLTYPVDSPILLSTGSTDIAKITRKRSKSDKHGHGNGKSAQEPGFSSKEVSTGTFSSGVVLGKFDGKADEGFFVGYSLNSKAFRVFNGRTRIVEENLHIRFSENTPNTVGSGPDWLFNIDALTRTMNYESIVAGTQSNSFASTKASDNEGQARKETEPVKDYILLPLWTADPPFSQDLKSSQDDGSKLSSDDGKNVDDDSMKKDDNVNSTNNVNAASTNEVNVVGGKTNIELPDDPNMLALEDISIFDLSNDDKDVYAEADMNNLDTSIQVSPIPTTRIHKDHPLDQVIRDLQSATQTRRMLKNLKKHGFVNERGIVIRNKERLVAQGYTQEEEIDYDKVFAPVARIEAIMLFLAYASFKDFMVYQMDVKSDFLYGKIKKEVYVCQPPGFEDPDFPDRVYKVEKALYGLHQDPRAWYETLSTYLLDNGFQRGKIDKTLFIRIQQKKDGIFISQDKYVGEILKKFRFIEVKTASTPMETQKPLLKDEDGKEVDVHMYRSMIGSLMYLTSSRPDIMFVVCACARYQVNPKVSHLHAVKRIFRYLKGQPKLGLWYPKDSPFDLVAYTDSDYAGACLDRKSTTGGY
ncbi:putative ribonuclease H-like domain-containing protein [Tanacetum coccineum]